MGRTELVALLVPLGIEIVRWLWLVQRFVDGCDREGACGVIEAVPDHGVLRRAVPSHKRIHNGLAIVKQDTPMHKP